jgi:hypothetical protein
MNANANGSKTTAANAYHALLVQTTTGDGELLSERGQPGVDIVSESDIW